MWSAPIFIELSIEAVKNSVSESLKVAYSVAISLENFGLVVAALGEAVGVGAIKSVKYVPIPIMDCSQLT